MESGDSVLRYKITKFERKWRIECRLWWKSDYLSPKCLFRSVFLSGNQKNFRLQLHRAKLTSPLSRAVVIDSIYPMRWWVAKWLRSFGRKFWTRKNLFRGNKTNFSRLDLGGKMWVSGRITLWRFERLQSDQLWLIIETDYHWGSSRLFAGIRHQSLKPG